MNLIEIKKDLQETKSSSIGNLVGLINRTRNEIGNSENLDELEIDVYLEKQKDFIRTRGSLTATASVLGCACVVSPFAITKTRDDIVGKCSLIAIGLYGLLSIANNMRKYKVVKRKEKEINSYRIAQGLKPVNQRKEIKERKEAIKRLNKFRRRGLNSYFVPKEY